MNHALRRARLPTGVQTFREVRTENLYYVDKTHFALRLIQEGKCYFLSRPRRFGKSLFVSTLKELFEGNRELFRGLAAYDQWDWSVRRPVARLAFASGLHTKPGGLHNNLLKQLRSHQRSAGIELEAAEGPDRFAELLEELHRSSGRRVVVLVDEYDKPITDNLARPDLARDNRDYLRALYAVVKDYDEHIRFSFFTGVSKFSKVSLFSGLNNLTDLTLKPEFSSVCGYTDHDLDTVFAPELEGLDRDEVRRSYNGYSWGGPERVYNPFDILLLLDRREFGAWWFETGTPRFLPDTLVRRGASTLRLERLQAAGGLRADADLLSAFDIDHIATEALLFQTGYLTVAEVLRDALGRTSYRLAYPNREVRIGLNRALLDSLTAGLSGRLAHCQDVARHIRSADFAAMEVSLCAFFASHPPRLAPQQPHPALRRLLRLRLLRPALRLRPRRPARGGLLTRQPRLSRDHSREDRLVRVQDRPQGAGLRQGSPAAQGHRLRRQAPRLQQAHPLGRRGAQHPGPQRDPRRVGAGRNRRRLNGAPRPTAVNLFWSSHSTTQAGPSAVEVGQQTPWRVHSTC